MLFLSLTEHMMSLRGAERHVLYESISHPKSLLDPCYLFNTSMVNFRYSYSLTFNCCFRINFIKIRLLDFYCRLRRTKVFV